MDLSDDELAYIAVHYHGPLGINAVKRNDEVRLHGFWGEVQVNLSALLPMNTALQPIFARADKRLPGEMRESYERLLRDTKDKIDRFF